MLDGLLVSPVLCWDEPFDSSLDGDINESDLCDGIRQTESANHGILTLERLQDLVMGVRVLNSICSDVRRNDCF